MLQISWGPNPSAVGFRSERKAGTSVGTTSDFDLEEVVEVGLS